MVDSPLRMAPRGSGPAIERATAADVLAWAAGVAMLLIYSQFWLMAIATRATSRG